jgi:hypothetical protein
MLNAYRRNNTNTTAIVHNSTATLFLHMLIIPTSNPSWIDHLAKRLISNVLLSSLRLANGFPLPGSSSHRRALELCCSATSHYSPACLLDLLSTHRVCIVLRPSLLLLYYLVATPRTPHGCLLIVCSYMCQMTSFNLCAPDIHF